MSVSMYRNMIWLVVESTGLDGIVDHLKDEVNVREIATSWVLDPQQFSQRLVSAKLIEWSLTNTGTGI